jgi:CheY-like chemotaxis protein
MKSPVILVVEDEPILGLELREDLTALGYEVPEVVPDGDRVLAAVIKYHPSLILMDIKLYGFRDGIDAVLQVKGFYEIPIVFLSSYPREQVEHRLKRTAPVAYLEKPYDPATIKDVIAGALATRN